MRARRAGLLAARALIGERRGVVVSVHARAVNLLFDDGPLVAVLPAESPLHPWAVALPVAARDLARVVEGARAGVADGALALGPLRIALDGLEVVDLRLARRLRAPVAAAARALARHGGPPPAAGPFEPALAGALARFGATGDVAGLAGIVGVGEGLTPAGDDVIVGVLAGLDAAREASRAAAGRRQRLLAALEKGAVATTRLSAQMLDAAGAGLYAEPVLGVLHALVRQPPSAPELRRAVAALLATGHRSGADTLRGIRAALEGPARARRTPRRTA